MLGIGARLAHAAAHQIQVQLRVTAITRSAGKWPSLFHASTCAWLSGPMSQYDTWWATPLKAVQQPVQGLGHVSGEGWNRGLRWHLRALCTVGQHAVGFPDAVEQPVGFDADAVPDRTRPRQRRPRGAQAFREAAVGERLVRMEPQRHALVCLASLGQRHKKVAVTAAVPESAICRSNITVGWRAKHGFKVGSSSALGLTREKIRTQVTTAVRVQNSCWPGLHPAHKAQDCGKWTVPVPGTAAICETKAALLSLRTSSAEHVGATPSIL